MIRWFIEIINRNYAEITLLMIVLYMGNEKYCNQSLFRKQSIIKNRLFFNLRMKFLKNIENLFVLYYK